MVAYVCIRGSEKYKEALPILDTLAKLYASGRWSHLELLVRIKMAYAQRHLPNLKE